jgi:hypothetical protein
MRAAKPETRKSKASKRTKRIIGGRVFPWAGVIDGPRRKASPKSV